MSQRLRRAVAFFAVAFCLCSAAGCFGRFRLVNAVYDFNRGVGHKLAESLVMWGLLIIPVYELAALGDILIFNVIEFYGGSVVVAQDQKLEDGSVVRVERVDGETLRIRHVDASGNAGSVEIVKVGDKAGYVRSADGRIVGMVEQLPDGRVVRTVP
ncbi:MAG TPA: DUF3332 family protein [Polyangia bacterium]|jgi:hypothetical protein|nr:DUF3332 family protein [Polyangia bacterium]